ncbi:hypothetical protein EX895_000501 [Sporisorium graminicola]|uniref:Uncharacterized protein n=1 Tax=Sporisorium graminicola TaxID=280036 RepID=A0A4U7L084_9BASI|nr:hypothetical protein EX895_000501 [Sporisorium graminicola]TKY90503.1 hypothetical protein EX895_000501 [Sporisorium graminicola]
MHVYPPIPGRAGAPPNGGAFDASFGYRPQGQQQPVGTADDSYNGGYQEGDFSTDTYDQPMMPASTSASRQPIFSQAAGPPQSFSNAAPAGRLSHNLSAAAAPRNSSHQPYPAAAATTGAGRQPIVAPMQFHRPIRHNSSIPSPTSPFQDPPIAPPAPSDGFAHQGAPAARGDRHDPESTPLAGAGDWASTSSLAPSPVEGPPPDYASFPPSVASHSQPHPRSLQPHSQQQPVAAAAASRVDPTVQRYHLSD